MLTQRDSAATQSSKPYRRDAEFTEIGVFLDQELFTLRPQRLCGEFLFEIDTISRWKICASYENLEL